MTPSRQLQTSIDQLFVGDATPLPNGEQSGIYKQATTERLAVTAQGVAGDTQADPENHGGAERALHQYPAEHHDHWRNVFDDPDFVPGVFGENISTRGVTEADVHVGDVFSLGSAVLQLAQPRQPCWKPGERLSHQTMARDLVLQGRAGWFYRVLEPGEIAAGDRLTRIETAAHGITLARFWALVNTRQPDKETREALELLRNEPALAGEWQTRIARRLGEH